jgi:MYXO-CTERM domain-containing protein
MVGMPKLRLRHALSFAALLTASAVAHEAHAQLLFQDQTSPFGAQSDCTPAGCWTNYTQMADMDGDGKLDVLLVNCGKFFSTNSTPQPLKIYAGDGQGALTNISSTAIGGFSGRVRQVAIGDIDGDGDTDFFAPDANGNADTLWVNNGNGTFTDMAATLIGGIHSHAGATRFADVDHDGDLDLFVADGYAGNAVAAHLYLNDGTGHFTEAPAGTLPNTLASSVDDFDVLDVDRDFDLDLLINVHGGADRLWINDGTGKFTDSSGGLPVPSGNCANPPPPNFPFINCTSDAQCAGTTGPCATNLHYDPGICDVDGDGDLDIVIDNTATDYKEQLLLNNGNGTFTDASSQITGNVGADDNGVACIDYDGDGDFDLVVPSLQSNGERVFQNDGTGHFSPVNGAFTGLQDGTLWIDFGDLTGDGRLDAVTGEGEATSPDHVYFGTNTVVVDTLPPKIIRQSAAMMGSSDTEVIFSISDNVATDTGPRLLQAWIQAGGTMVAAHFMGGDLYRAVVPAATVPAGTELQSCAQDRQGNMICDVAPATTSSTTSVTTSTGAMSTGASMASGTGNGTSGGTGSGMSTGSGGAGGNGSGGGSDGCGCKVAGDDEGGSLAAIGVFALGALAVSRRRRPR